MVTMRLVRNHTRLIGVIALAWHFVAIAAVSTVLSCDTGPAIEHAGMENCPMQQKAEPACPLHAEERGGHDCDCPTLGCSETDAGFMALFGAVGILPAAASIDVPVPASNAAPGASARTIRLASVPPAPPPRA